ncbi:hypothetical protein TVAG_313590 [Trichomonas vaginalis G3]|uniref:PCI domain containing protein n=1 Tax=Trichomonas vaginalis (strain ATCC PRA-98 / G3) TaxID=412133 RepID=A2GBI7_TRIV3|nr:hypothetical protein TVAGG3_0849520 [Trichomonas vaginalis G3]EAX85478.1 hypothetical protein TVAG_313590 [Trichomonas vaginalis G3]KAI5499877.1 hypothetical protein TVAGG3_0849520 [Trichomonas vaginalis G3]|eukprot:XP_001298408.1 hypothetical protein [Trichomonas vaginalis G3]
MTAHVLRSIPQTIGSVRTVHDIPKITEWAYDLTKQFSPTNVAGYCQMNFTPVQYAALAFTVPTHYAPEQIYIICKKSFKILSELEPKYQTGLMMIFAKAAFLCNQEDEALEILKTFTEVDPLIFTSPYLYLAATAKKPVAVMPPPNMHRRSFAFSLYYSGINHMMLFKYDDAFKLLLHCLHLPCQSDMIPKVISAFSLVCFLNHYTKKQFIGVLPPKAEIDPVSMCLWDGRKIPEKNQMDYPKFYLYFWDEIVKEKIMRNIIFCSRTISRLSISKLKDLCGCFDENKLFEYMNDLTSKHQIQYVYGDDKIVAFTPAPNDIDLQEQLKSVEKLLDDVKSIQEMN